MQAPAFRFGIIQGGNSFVIPPLVIFELRRWLLDNPTPNLMAFAQEFDTIYQSVRNSAVKSRFVKVEICQNNKSLGL